MEMEKLGLYSITNLLHTPNEKKNGKFILTANINKANQKRNELK